ncbi:MAG: shikimate kinase [Daejeonella sp.]|uniref:shikimate kinase n=1 Tax=Daejeonella sp. JGW-45 TaxID=3034148 RepID=UPI0023ED1E3F|nr:shikimate kinase [Daejeonella sp. JGW-45]
MKVFLIGFMGSGKTTIGKKLANYLKYDFIDLDKFIEARAGMTIVEYFAAHGEAAFREMESEVLQKTDYPENVIIATGGGTPCYSNNMEWMNEHGKVAYLSLPPKALASRLENSTADRPLIRNLKGDDLVDFITEKLKEREVFYNQSKCVISASDLTAERLAYYLNLGFEV